MGGNVEESYFGVPLCYTARCGVFAGGSNGWAGLP